MPFPEHIARVFDDFGIAADTMEVLYDLYVTMGDEVLEVFGDIAEHVDSPATLRPDDCAPIRARVVERYLRRNHPRWAAGLPTPSLYHPRAFEGRVSGAAIPLGNVQPETAGLVEDAIPDGILMQGSNAHLDGLQETISFDFVAAELDDAIARQAQQLEDELALERAAIGRERAELAGLQRLRDGAYRDSREIIARIERLEQELPGTAAASAAARLSVGSIRRATESMT